MNAARLNTFRDSIDRGLVTTLDQLKSLYKATVKQFHPDLNGPGAPPVDFDRLKQDYADAFRYLVALADAASASVSATALETKEALLDEFRELVARGFPVNIQAAAKNPAYAGSIRRVARSLELWSGDAEFFPRANREARALKRLHPKIHWYALQIFWNLGDWRVTGYDYYRRIFQRHLEFIRETLVDEGFGTVLRLLEYLTETPTPAASKSAGSPR